jgi:predicted DNA-binding protein
MRERKYRAQILLEPQQHTILAEIARQGGQSVSHVVREIVAQYLAAQEQEARCAEEAFERIQQHRAAILARRGGSSLDVDITELIDQMREERDDDLVASITRRD